MLNTDGKKKTVHFHNQTNIEMLGPRVFIFFFHNCFVAIFSKRIADLSVFSECFNGLSTESFFLCRIKSKPWEHGATFT